MKNKVGIKKMAICGIMGALSFILMLCEISIPIIPSFIKFDISELPALITSFALSPIYGVLVCFIKNLIHLPLTSTLCIGEISNFLLGAVFVFTAGLVYKHHKSRKGALIGSLIGAVSMAVIGVFTNYYIVYPLYAKLFMPESVILKAYSTILPLVKNLWQAILIFNLPFTFVKGIVVALICFVIYKRISPLLKKWYSN